MSDKRIAIKTSISIFGISDFFICLFIILTYIVTSIDSREIFFRLRFIALFLAGMAGFGQLFISQVTNKRIVIFILICSLSWFFSYIIRGEHAYDPNLFFYSFLYMGVGVSLASHRHNIKFASIMFYVVSLTILVRILILNEPIRGFLKDGTTYNFISVLVLLYLSYFCIALIQNGKTIPYVLAIVYAWVSLLAYGRGGIVTGIFFLLFITIFAARNETNKQRKRLIWLLTILTIIVLAVIAFLYFKRGNYELFKSLFAKFYVRRGEKEPRLEIWGEYIADCTKNIGTLLFGANSDKYFIDGNLHNAFFQMYASMGLFPTLILLCSFLRLAWYLYRNKHYYFLCLLLTIIIRSMTDKTAFQGYCEPVFYYIVFTWFNVKEKGDFLSYKKM